MKWVLIAFIRSYRLIISPFLGNCCRFSPSCSAYAEEAVIKKGVFSGAWLSVMRLLKCQPFHSGGYNPVEE